MAFPSFVEQNLLPAVLRVHDAVYQKTNGWIGHRALVIPSLLLHTVGAKTGQARTASLTYARDGGNYLIVASKGGDPKAPGWYHNLRANPLATIVLDGVSREVAARELSGDERERGYRRGEEVFPAFSHYRHWAPDRRIPVLRLEPR